MFPDGMNMLNMPSDLAACLDHAYRILSWMENLPEDEMPDRWMWHLDWEIDAHFDVVKAKREAKHDLSPGESEEELDWEQNSFASRFKD